MHPAGAGIQAGIKFGVLLALFQLGSYVLHNHMMLNIGWRLHAAGRRIRGGVDDGGRRHQPGLSRLVGANQLT